MSQGASEIEALRRRLEVVETELKLVLEGNGGQEEPTEGGGEQKRDGSALTVQSGRRSGRKSHRGVELILIKLCRFLSVSESGTHAFFLLMSFLTLFDSLVQRAASQA